MEKLYLFEDWQTKQHISSRYTMEFARKVAKKLNLDIISYIETGTYGSAYKVDGYKVMKITTDQSEAFTAYNLIGENTKHIVKYYEVYELISSELIKPTYVIIMEYLITLLEYSENVRAFFDYFSAEVNFESFFKKDTFNTPQVEYFKSKYFKNCNNCLSEEEVDKYIDKLKEIVKDTMKYDIYPVDIHSGNLGFRVIDEDLIYFDVGVNENYTEVDLKKIVL